MAHRLSRVLAALLFACPLLHAAELGDPRVSSYIGQQLVADVELTALEDAADPVRAQLASADVYRGASIAMPPELASLHLAVMRRDGRQFLHLTTLRPVGADHLHVFLELADGKQRSVRLATLWLTPDPNPAPPPAAAVAPARPAPAPAVLPPRAAPAVSAPQPLAAPAPAVSASGPSAAPAPAPRPVPLPKPAKPAQHPVHAERRHALPSAASALPPAPAACPQQVPVAESSACAALDGKNAALRAEIGQLEGKVRALQVAMTAAPAVLPKVQPAPRRANRKHAPAQSSPLWRWIAGGVAFLVAGGGAAFAIRRARQGSTKKSWKAKPEMEVVVTPRVMSDVKSRLMTDVPAEPALD